jgi:hypothetical protein
MAGVVRGSGIYDGIAVKSLHCLKHPTAVAADLGDNWDYKEAATDEHGLDGISPLFTQRSRVMMVARMLGSTAHQEAPRSLLDIFLGAGEEELGQQSSDPW